jgi:hypothetical protein
MRIVKDQTHGVAVPAAHKADTAALARNRTLVYGEGHGIALMQRHYIGALIAGTALGHDELAPREILAGLRQQDGNLHWKHMFAIQILMQAIVIALAILKHQRCRPCLACPMAPFQKYLKGIGVADINAKLLIPPIGDGDQIRI